MMNIDLERDYSVLGLTARLERRTDCSAMFHLGRIGNTLEMNGRTLMCAPGRVFSVVGWLDIHYPCHGFHKLAIRALYHEAGDTFKAMHGIVRAVKEWLELDDSVAYDVMLIVGETQHSMQDPIDGIPSYINRGSFDVPGKFCDEWDARLGDRNDDGE